MSKSNRSLCVLFYRTGAGLCIYHLFVWSNLNFLHISQWIPLPTQSCLVLYSFCANLLHSLIIWLTVPSLSPHSLHLLFCCVLSILALIWLVLMVLFCVAIRRDSVSLLKFPFLSHVQVISVIIILSRGYDSAIESSRYDTKLSDDETLIILEIWGMRSNPSWPWVLVLDLVLPMSQIELFGI